MRSQHEDTRDVARAVGRTAAYQQTRRDRKKVEILFAHMKRKLKGLTQPCFYKEFFNRIDPAETLRFENSMADSQLVADLKTSRWVSNLRPRFLATRKVSLNYP
jgi:hypothetical protein